MRPALPVVHVGHADARLGDVHDHVVRGGDLRRGDGFQGHGLEGFEHEGRVGAREGGVAHGCGGGMPEEMVWEERIVEVVDAACLVVA